MITTLLLNVCWNQIEQTLLLRYLLIASSLFNIIQYKQIDAKTARNNLTCLYFQTFKRFLCTFVLYSMAFVIDLFSNVLFQTFDYIWKQVPTKLFISLCWHILCKSSLDPLKLIPWLEFQWSKHCINLELLSADLP